ncbi:sigma-70 family RNA polymerase sigma factor [bacterium]|nr:sigma-70 family RNA polymerase sigma factor [bacterium]
MPTADPATLAARLARLAGDTTDADLLARYSRERDEGAFTELVRRHGPAVLAACRRLTGHAHDAEDAFQATFLVLARKAHHLRPGPPLGGWLYGVAVRAARKAKERSWRRREVSGAVPDVPERTAEPCDPDAARAVIEEVEQLPDFLRAAVVLCELEGRSRAEAARELGIAEGTLSSRLAAARKRLAARLAARGFGPAALAALAGVVVPRDLSAAAAALAPGAAVITLATGVRRTMMVRHLRSVPLVLGAIGAAALVAGILTGQPPTPPAAAAPGATPPAAAGTGRIYVWRRGELIGLDPTGGNEASALVGRTEISPYAFAVSPGGKRAAFIQSQDGTGRLLVRELGPDMPVTTLQEAEDTQTTFAWSGDGTELAVCRVTIDGPRRKATTEVVTVATKARTPVALPEDHLLIDWARDGRSFLTVRDSLPDEKAPLPGDEPQGKILRRLAKNVVEIDRGSRSAVKPGQTYTVLPADFPKAGRASRLREFRVPDGRGVMRTKVEFVPKATVEVTEVLGPALSRARITGEYDPISDATTVGDLLYTRPSGPTSELWLMNRDGTAGRRLAGEKHSPDYGRFSPDGRAVLAWTRGTGPGGKRTLVVIRLATGEVTPVAGTDRAVLLFCWSPDGRRVAYTWVGRPSPDSAAEVDDRLTVCDPDGGNARTILSARRRVGTNVALHGVDWR